MVLKLYNSKDDKKCLYCGDMFESDEYSFGRDMNVEDKSLIYIRKHKDKFSLVCENEDFDTSCEIFYCPICGKKLN